MPDRFQFIDNPPKIVGNCDVCGEEIQEGYEKTCAFCDTLVCESCERVCWICEKKECKLCMTNKDFNGEYICDLCSSNLEYAESLIKSGIDVQSYYHSGKVETDEEIILEYSSNENPNFKVSISKEDAGKAVA